MKLSLIFCVFVLFACIALADELRVGFTYAKKSTNQTPFTALEIWAKQLNDTGGIVLNNGTTYFVKLITYDDNENCELVDILYERLYVVDKVQVFMHPGAGNCQAAANWAEKLNVPTLNARSSYVAYQWTNHTWVYTLFPPFTGVTDGCNAILNATNALTRTVLVYCNETGGLILPQQFSDRKYNTTYLEKVYMPPSMWSNVTGDINTQRAFVAAQVKRWKLLKPSALIWSGCGSVNFIDALRRTKWTPPALYSFGATMLTGFRSAAGWKAEGLLSIAANDYSENFTDPVWGNTPTYVSMYRQMYNATPDTLIMTISALGVILSESIKIAQTLEPFALRQAIHDYNATIFYGPVAWKNYLMARNDPCYQHYPGDKLIPVWPTDYFNAQPLAYPYNLIYPADFLESLKKKPNLPLRYGLMGMGIALFVTIAVGLIISLLIWKKYSIIFIPNSTTNNEEWGDSPVKTDSRTDTSANCPGCCVHF